MNIDHKNRNVWEKYIWIWSVIFVLALFGPVSIAVTDEGVTTAESGQIWLVALALTIFHGAVVWLDRQQGPIRVGRPLLSVTYIIALYVGFVWLVPLNPIFFFFLCALYNQTFIYLDLKYSIPAAAFLSALTVYLQIQGSGGTFSLSSPDVWFFFFISGISITLAYWIDVIMKQSLQRKALIEQLEATRDSLAVAQRQAGVLQERERLAREIHDTLAQGFTSIIAHLEAGEQMWETDRTASQNHLAQAKGMARQGLNQARRVVQDLRPEVLEQSPLPEAIERVVNGWSQQSGIAAQTAVTGDHLHLHPEAETTMLRAVQEALHNVEKHAQATAVQVTLSYMGDVLMLDVQDDGVGLQHGREASDLAPKGTGFGLTAMKQRVTQVGGTVEIESEPDEGTTLVVQLPIMQLMNDEQGEVKDV